MTTRTSDPGQAESNLYKSMGLKALLQELHESCRYTILDLGPALGVNVDFWSRFSCRLYFQDLYESLVSELGSGIECERLDPSLLERLLPFESNTRFDIILCWDILNHLTHEQVVSLLDYLSGFCKPSTFLFAIFWLGPQIPSRPITFRIIDRERIEYTNRPPATKSCASYQPRDVGKLMEGFRVSNSFLLRHGVQEYLFNYIGRDQDAPGC